MLPVDEPAAEVERQALVADMKGIHLGAPESFESK
jgi:hypothetical protein